MKSRTTDLHLCAMCEKGLDGINETNCQRCGCFFHYYWTDSQDFESCGALASHDDALANVFLCIDCIKHSRN